MIVCAWPGSMYMSHLDVRVGEAVGVVRREILRAQVREQQAQAGDELRAALEAGAREGE